MLQEQLLWVNRGQHSLCLALNHMVSKDCITSEDPVAKSMVSEDEGEEMKMQSLLPLPCVSQHNGGTSSKPLTGKGFVTSSATQQNC